MTVRQVVEGELKRLAIHTVQDALNEKYGIAPKLKDIDLLRLKEVDSIEGHQDYEAYVDVNGKGYGIRFSTNMLNDAVAVVSFNALSFKRSPKALGLRLMCNGTDFNVIGVSE